MGDIWIAGLNLSGAQLDIATYHHAPLRKLNTNAKILYNFPSLA